MGPRLPITTASKIFLTGAALLLLGACTSVPVEPETGAAGQQVGSARILAICEKLSTNNDTRLAIGLCEKAHVEDPDNPVPLLLLGDMLQQQGALAQAGRAYGMVIDLEPDNVEAHYGLGKVFLARNQFELAIEQFEVARELNTRDHRLYNAIGVVLDNLGDHVGAQAHYKIGLELAPNNHALLKNMTLSRRLDNTVTTPAIGPRHQVQPAPASPLNVSPSEAIPTVAPQSSPLQSPQPRSPGRLGHEPLAQVPAAGTDSPIETVAVKEVAAKSAPVQSPPPQPAIPQPEPIAALEKKSTVEPTPARRAEDSLFAGTDSGYLAYYTIGRPAQSSSYVSRGAGAEVVQKAEVVQRAEIVRKEDRQTPAASHVTSSVTSPETPKEPVKVAAAESVQRIETQNLEAQNLEAQNLEAQNLEAQELEAAPETRNGPKAIDASSPAPVPAPAHVQGPAKLADVETAPGSIQVTAAPAAKAAPITFPSPTQQTLSAEGPRILGSGFKMVQIEREALEAPSTPSKQQLQVADLPHGGFRADDLEVEALESEPKELEVFESETLGSGSSKADELKSDELKTGVPHNGSKASLGKSVSVSPAAADRVEQIEAGVVPGDSRHASTGTTIRYETETNDGSDRRYPARLLLASLPKDEEIGRQRNQKNDLAQVPAGAATGAPAPAPLSLLSTHMKEVDVTRNDMPAADRVAVLAAVEADQQVRPSRATKVRRRFGREHEEDHETRQFEGEVWDLVDVVNPLQHIPVVAAIYRDVTDDEIKPAARIAGGTLFGGILGFASSLVDSVVEEASGQDIGETAIAAFFNPDADSTGEVTLAQREREAVLRQWRESNR
ncbi:tetratricopeptide repeat protein [Pelagibius sp. Alg239-R121]|uniref:tetratricopeptide repeat protein n=1 Tax=Pelagibius sp. Alg239-R121 TaxID=2993448 RepID=UPI0024A68144|nr:tetratricopeptide repeat protein [Pelagibius sp. Alg239-R121]